MQSIKFIAKEKVIVKRRLINKELGKVSGGYIYHLLNVSYIVSGKTDEGTNVDVDFEDNFYSAIKYDWENFKEQYKNLGIKSLELLAIRYKYGRFYN